MQLCEYSDYSKFSCVFSRAASRCNSFPTCAQERFSGHFFFFSVVALFTRTFMPPQTSKRFFDADAQKEPLGESGSEMGFSDGEQT